jgi:hypothetical protein
MCTRKTYTENLQGIADLQTQHFVSINLATQIITIVIDVFLVSSEVNLPSSW